MLRLVLLLTQLGLATVVTQAADQVVTDFGDNGGPNQLRAKLNAAQNSGGGTITFNVGFATIVLQQGVLPVTTNCTIYGGDSVTISGNDKTPVFYVANAGTLTLNDLVVSHGSNSADGGAIRNFGTLKINSCMFTNNVVSGFSGGAILSLGQLDIANSEFAFNSAENGGALYIRFAGAVTTITGSSFHDNTATNQTSAWGGAMLIWDGAAVTVDHSTFTKNGALSGGAFYLFGGSGGTTLTLITSAATGNTAVQGGGAYVTAGSTLTATDTTFSTNTSTGSNGTDDSHGSCANTPPGDGQPGAGGGLYNTGTSTFTRCTFDSNTAAGGVGGRGADIVFLCSGSDGATGGAGTGGAIFNAAVLTLTNCTMSGNRAIGGQGGAGGSDAFGAPVYDGGRGGDGFGGCVYNSGTLTLGNCTIAGNAGVVGAGGSGSQAGGYGSSQGGGIYSAGGTNNVRNDLIAQNTASNGGDDVLGAFTSQGYNLVRIIDGSSGFASGANHDLVGTGVSPFEPQLDPNGLQNNGGLTGTIALLANSRAIDAGTTSGAPPTDQRVYTRVGPPDMGAFEFNGVAPVLKITSIMRQNGHVILQGRGVPSSSHNIEAAADPNGADFGSIGAAISDATGIFQYDDPGAVSLTKRFYRVAFP